MAKQLRLSQCMIVRDEEDNIRNALSWGKTLAYEQIVVDTGSTDNTVAIAESLGAKVYHYKWDNDFAAAKNYAISLARGEWIAFLDADEYFREKDIGKLRNILVSFAANPAQKKIEVIQCTMLHVDEKGTPFSSMKQSRIFRNSPLILYKNKIHEQLSHKNGRQLIGADLGADIPIIHTGYSAKAYSQKDKAKRNLSIIREELEKNPENYNNWSYLGDSLLIEGDIQGAKEAYRRILEHPKASVNIELRLNSISNLMRFSIEDSFFTYDDMMYIYQQYLQLGREHPDVEYWIGIYMMKNKLWEKAVEHLEKALHVLEGYTTSFTLYIVGQLPAVYGFLADAYLMLKDKPSAVRNFSLALKADKYQERTISVLLSLFYESGEFAEGVAAFLLKIYSLQNLKDKLFLIKAAKSCGFVELEQYLRGFLTEDENIWLESEKRIHPLLTVDEIAEAYPDVVCKNRVDIEFFSSLYYFGHLSEKEMMDHLKGIVADWMEDTEKSELIKKMVDFYTVHLYWGKFDPYVENYETFNNRINVMRSHAEELLWVYKNLQDYRSKRVFSAILRNWYSLELKPLEEAKENLRGYDTDIIETGKDEVLVDIQSGTGDYVKDFINKYGQDYRHIYCCENRESMLVELNKYLDMNSQMSLLECEYPDCDLISDATLFRINVRDKLEEVLLALKEVISENRPKLVLSNFFSYDDIWKIPQMIKEFYPGYVFYMRYEGEDLIPTDYVLYAVTDGKSSDMK